MLKTLLTEDPEFAQVARERLKLIVFQPAIDATQQTVQRVDDVLMLDIHADEGSPGFGGDDALRALVRAAVVEG